MKYFSKFALKTIFSSGYPPAGTFSVVFHVTKKNSFGRVPVTNEAEREIGTPVGRALTECECSRCILGGLFDNVRVLGHLGMPWWTQNGSHKDILVVTSWLQWVTKGDWNTCWMSLNE
jgi:hypothetical protein